MSSTETTTDAVTVRQYTDPMCTWCWGSEPIRRHLRTAYRGGIRFEYVMGGLVEDFDEFTDPANDISEPADVAAHWQEAAEIHGMPVNTAIFETDPARSTYPASEAFAAARLTSADLSGRYLRRLREAYTTEVRNVNSREVQEALATDVGLDVDAFVVALEDGRAREAFESDLAWTRETGIRAFPTYDVVGPDGERRLAGFRSFPDLETAVGAVAPELERYEPPALEAFVAEYGPVATQEVAEVYGHTREEAHEALSSLADGGALHREPRETGTFWHPSDVGGRQ